MRDYHSKDWKDEMQQDIGNEGIVIKRILSLSQVDMLIRALDVYGDQAFEEEQDDITELYEYLIYLREQLA